MRSQLDNLFDIYGGDVNVQIIYFNKSLDEESKVLLIKALKHGFYGRIADGGWLTTRYISGLKCRAVPCKEHGIDITYKESQGSPVYLYYVEGYGKSWALTRDELIL